jgi:hypothetical protein
LKTAAAKGVKVILPKDHLVVTAIDAPDSATETKGTDISGDLIGVDIGPQSIENLVQPILSAKTIFWNGPMGIFEVDRYAGAPGKWPNGPPKRPQRAPRWLSAAATAWRRFSPRDWLTKFLIFQRAAERPWNFWKAKELPGVTALQ